MMKITESVVVVSKDKGTMFLQKSKEALELLIATPEGTVPLDRAFGLNQSFLSLPPETAKTLFAQELIDKAEKYIPEISITEIDYKIDGSGTAQPIITVCKNEDYDEQESTDDDLNTDEDNYFYDSDDPDDDMFIESEDDEDD